MAMLMRILLRWSRSIQGLFCTALRIKISWVEDDNPDVWCLDWDRNLLPIVESAGFLLSVAHVADHKWTKSCPKSGKFTPFPGTFFFMDLKSYHLKINFWNRTSTKSSKIHHAFFPFSNAKNMVISLLGTAGMNIQSGFPASDASLKPWCRSSAPPLFLKLLGIIYIYIYNLKKIYI